MPSCCLFAVLYFVTIISARNRLINEVHVHKKHSHAANAHLAHYHRYHPYKKKNGRRYDYGHSYAHAQAKQVDYDKQLEIEEIRDLFANYYMNAFEEAATSQWLVGNANLRAPGNEILRRSGETGVIQVTWPDKQEADKFKWDDYVDRVDKGELSGVQQRSVYSSTGGEFGLRKHTEMQLLEFSMDQVTGVNLEYNEDCLVDLGSNTPKSDLDFSYIRWDDVTKVVQSLIVFYNQFYALYDGWPLEVFDLNFYIATGFIKQEPDHPCWQSIAGAPYARMRNLFTEIWVNQAGTKSWHELSSPGGYHNRLYARHDTLMCYLLIQRRFEYDFTEKGANTKIVNLVKYSEIFYQYINRVRTTAALTYSDGVVDHTKLDRVKMFLKTLLYFMNYWSDESYVSNQALQLIIGKSVDDVSDDGKYLAALDCIVFINRYHKEAIKKNPKSAWDEERKLLWFWDRASKYIARVGKVLQLSAVPVAIVCNVRIQMT